MDRSGSREPMRAFVTVLRAHRRRLGMTQEELAGKTGLAARSIGKLEAGRIARPRPVTLRLLADAFGLTGAERDSFCGMEVAGQGGWAVVPAQLPADVAGFAGRTEQLDQLDALLSGTNVATGAVVISAIGGTAGVGKTALAVHWAHRGRDRFPDGQLCLDLHGFTEGTAPLEPVDALDRLLRALGVPGERIPADLDDRAGLWRSVVAGRRLLILLDNAATAAQVRPLLPGSPGCLVVVTSRRDLASLEPTHTVGLDVLPAADAVTLFTRTAGPGRVGAERPELLAEIVELCGRLPLAIRIAAARFRARPSWRLSDMAGRLRDQDQRLAELADADGSRSVTAALEVSYQQLTTDQQRMYRLLGLHPGHHIERYAAAALASSDLELARRLLDQLVDANLLPEPTPGRYVFHDLVRSHASRTAARDEPEPARRAALTRLLDHYLRTVLVATDTAYPYLSSDRARSERARMPVASGPCPNVASPAKALAWLDAELPNLMAVFLYAADHGWPEPALQLATGLFKHLHIRGDFRTAVILHNRSLALARSIGDRAAELRSLCCLGWVHLQKCEYPQAIDNYRQVQVVAKAVNDPPGEVYGRIGIGDVLLRQGRYGPAFRHAARALALTRVTDVSRGTEVWIRNVLSYLHLLQGRPRRAAEQYRRSLEIAERIGDHGGRMYARLGLGDVERRLGRLDAAREHYLQAMRAALATGNRGHLVDPLLALGDADRRQQRYEQAAAQCRQALEIVQEINHRRGLCKTHCALGRLHHATGEPAVALTHHRQALELATDLQHLADQACAHEGIARAYLALRQPERARQHWQAALDILTTLGTEQTHDDEASARTIRAHLARVELVA